MDDFLNKNLIENLRLFRFSVYSNIFIEQTEQDFLYFLVEGRVQCTHYHGNGKAAVIALSTPFCAIGDVEIMSRERINSNVIASIPSVMLGIPVNIVRRYGTDDPKFLRFLIHELGKKLYTNDSLRKNQALPVASRLVLYILSEPEIHPGMISLPDKETLASLLGTTERHLNRILHDLSAAGGIGRGYPAVRIIDRSKLEEYALG
jgi:CRP-like cAMP-binding protein